MSNAATYQKRLKIKLKQCFVEVDLERSVIKDAEDVLKRDPLRYAPRLDLVIGPYNLKAHDQWKEASQIKKTLFSFRNDNTKEFFKIISRLKTNHNPRYAVAVEVVFSGSSKHILGDITNASTLGLYGFVIANEKMLSKTQRILKHLQSLKGLGKIAPNMFNNIKIVSMKEFDNYFS